MRGKPRFKAGITQARRRNAAEVEGEGGSRRNGDGEGEKDAGPGDAAVACGVRLESAAVETRASAAEEAAEEGSGRGDKERGGEEPHEDEVRDGESSSGANRQLRYFAVDTGNENCGVELARHGA